MPSIKELRPSPLTDAFVVPGCGFVSGDMATCFEILQQSDPDTILVVRNIAALAHRDSKKGDILRTYFTARFGPVKQVLMPRTLKGKPCRVAFVEMTMADVAQKVLDQGEMHEVMGSSWDIAPILIKSFRRNQLEEVDEASQGFACRSSYPPGLLKKPIVRLDIAVPKHSKPPGLFLQSKPPISPPLPVSSTLRLSDHIAAYDGQPDTLHEGEAKFRTNCGSQRKVAKAPEHSEPEPLPESSTLSMLDPILTSLRLLRQHIDFSTSTCDSKPSDELDDLLLRAAKLHAYQLLNEEAVKVIASVQGLQKAVLTLDPDPELVPTTRLPTQYQ